MATTPTPTATQETTDNIVLPEGGRIRQNEVMITGTLGRHPELRYTPSGTPVCNFSMAHNEGWKDANDEYQQKTHWVNITQFGQKAEATAAAFGKGDTVHVRGSLAYSTWTGDDDKPRSKLEIKAYDITLIRKRKEVVEGSSQAERQS